MKLPIFGFNQKHSYIDFENAFGKIRFGLEELKFFVENVKTGVRTFITDVNGNIVAPIISSSINIVEGIITTLHSTLVDATTVNAVDIVATSGGFDNVSTGILNTDTLVLVAGTPVNAVVADEILILGAAPAEGETVTIGTTTYKFRLTALGAGVAASAILTNNQTAPSDGDIVTIGTRNYRFKTIPAQANDIGISTASVSVLRLFKAMHLTGIEGSDYFAGTQAIDIAATAIHTSEFVITLTANAVGYAGNLFAKATTAVTFDWDGAGATFSGGIDAQAANDVFMSVNAEGAINNLVLAILGTGVAGTNYGTGTVEHPNVIAVKKDADEMTVTAKVKGAAGNTIALAETLANAGSKWTGDAVFLSGGVSGTVGVKGAMFIDATYLYYCIAANTTAGTNWRRIALGSAY